MKLAEKDTSSGRDIREYQCTQCGYSDWEDRGIALWQALSDAREATPPAPSVVPAPAAAVTVCKSGWQRLLTRLHLHRRS
jgi:hypothetical protein